MKLLYLGLKVFSATGGIEQVNKNWLFALSSLADKGKLKFMAMSLYDDNSNGRYVHNLNFRGFKNNPFLFGLSVIWNSFSSNVMVISHLNLSLFALIAKLLNPRLTIILQLHGIEAWANLSGVQERLLNQSYKILAVSKFTRNTVLNKYPKLENKIIVFNNSLDGIAKYQFNEELRNKFRSKLNIDDNQKLIITIGRLLNSEAYKGYDKTIEAIASLKNKSVVFHIIGKSEEIEKERIQKLIIENNLQTQVKLIGFVNDDELISYYQAADLFVMPSKGEGFGLVFIDAMANGLRVIGGNADGSLDAISNFSESYLVNPDDVNEIANSITIALNTEWNIDDKNKLSQNCKELFSAEKFELKIAQLLF
jgi:glycosyltransferase involved in cell wall biosynthesis